MVWTASCHADTKLCLSIIAMNFIGCWWKSDMGIPPYRGHSKMESDGQPVNIRGTKIEALVEQRTPSTHLIFDAWNSAVGKTWKLLRKTRASTPQMGWHTGVLEARCMRNVLVRVYSAGLQIHVFCGGLDSWNLMKSSMDTWRFAVEISSLQHRVPPNYKLT